MPTPQALAFLDRLARNNNRVWFQKHRSEYETALLEPLREFVDEMDARLAVLAPEFVGDRRRSVFRIHRDVRFSRDKRPYKTNAAIWLFHRDAGRTKGLHDSVAAAGFYYHLEPGACIIGGGLWMPPSPSLRRIRTAIVADADEEGRFGTILRARAFRRTFGALDEDPGTMLTRLPRGYGPDTPAAQWLRYKSFTATVRLTDEQATAADLVDRFAESCRILLPLMRWLNAALGYPPASRR